MPSVLETKERVRAILTDEFGSVDVDSDGDFSLRNGSARVFVRVGDLDDDQTIVKLFSMVTSGATPSDALFEYVAVEGAGYYLGRLGARELPNGTVDLWLTHRLLGDTLDPEELIGSVVALAVTADELDDDLVARFGGSVFHEG